MQVCIIGAGAAGLCAAKQAIDHNIIPTIYEQSKTIGGTWVYTKDIGTDKNGLDVHSSMYKGLRTNLPKEIMGYPNFPIKNYMEDDETSYISSARICQFLDDYTVKFNLRSFIKFEHYVIRVEPLENKWKVAVVEMNMKSETTAIYDYIMICNGHYHTPMYPLIEGFQNFKGTQLHSHDYRDPRDYTDQNVLVIGAGPSGMDICNEISRYATTVTISHHLPQRPKTLFSKNVCEKPDVKCLNETGAQFIDNSFKEFSAIIYCTGYKYAYPFLSVNCGIFVDENYVQPLYKHCINIKYSTMAFIGIPFYVCAFQMMDLQARFVIKHVWKNINPPTKDSMLEDMLLHMETRWKKGFKKRQAHMMGPDQGEYYEELSTTCNTDNIAVVNTSLHNESSERFLDDLVNFRKDIFKILDNEKFIYYKKVNQV